MPPVTCQAHAGARDKEGVIEEAVHGLGSLAVDLLHVSPGAWCPFPVCGCFKGVSVLRSHWCEAALQLLLMYGTSH